MGEDTIHGLEHRRRERRALASGLQRLRVLAASSRNRQTVRRNGTVVTRELRMLVARLARRFAWQDAGGDMGNVIGTSTRLEQRMAALRDQHVAITVDAVDLLRRARTEESSALADAIFALAETIEDHLRRRIELIHSAIADDIEEFE